METKTKYTGIARREGEEGATYVARASVRLANGRRQFWTETFKTLQAAQRGRRDWLADHEQQQEGLAGKATLLQACTTWVATVPPLKAPKTEAEYRRVVARFLVPSALASEQLQRLTTARIQTWINDLGVGDRTRELIYLRLCQVLDLAVEHRLLRMNPARAVKVKKSRPRRGRYLTLEQVQAFLAQAQDDHFAPIWHVALATGMRRGELLGLQWKDVDFDAGTLSVSGSVVWISGPFPQDRTKTPSSTRVVHIDPETLERLRAHYQHRHSDGYVFATRAGTPIGANNLHRHFKDLLAAASLPLDTRIHDLRHTSLSHILNNGVPVTTVVKRGGYRNANTLFATYAHPDSTQDARAAAVSATLVSQNQGAQTSETRTTAHNEHDER